MADRRQSRGRTRPQYNNLQDLDDLVSMIIWFFNHPILFPPAPPPNISDLRSPPADHLGQALILGQAPPTPNGNDAPILHISIYIRTTYAILHGGWTRPHHHSQDLLGPPEPGEDHEHAADLAPLSEEEEAVLQEALEIAGAVLPESGGDDHDHNVHAGHNNVINQPGFEGPLTPHFLPVDNIIVLLGPPEPGEDHEHAADLAPLSEEEEEAVLQKALEIAGAVLPESGGDDHDHNVHAGHNNVINQPGFEGPIIPHFLPVDNIIVLLGPPEPGEDHEHAADLAPLSEEEEEAVLQKALEIAGAVLPESGGDDHDHNVHAGHNNVISQDQLQSIKKSVAMPGSTAQVNNDETRAVQMINDRMDFVVDDQQGQDAFWGEILHAGGDHQAGDDGKVEVNNDDAGAHAEPVLAQPDDVNIGDHGDANVEVIKDDHEELPNDANIENGGGMHEADQGDHQEADVITAHDYAVEAVRDDEVLHDESEAPVGEQAAASNVDVNISEGAVHGHHQAAGDVDGDDDLLVDAIAEQPAVNVVEDVTAGGDGLPMHDGDQGADANVEEVVGEDDEMRGEPVPRQIMIGSTTLDIIDGAGIVHNAAGDQAAGNNNMVQPELKCDDEVEFPPPLGAIHMSTDPIGKY